MELERKACHVPFLVNINVRIVINVIVIINIVVFWIGKTSRNRGGWCNSPDNANLTREMIRTIFHRVNIFRPLRFLNAICQLVDIVF